MPAWRDIRSKAREVVHAAFRVPVVYVPPTGPASTVHVRLHTGERMFGALPGGARNEVYAQETVANPTAIFWLPDGVQPVPQALISVSADEAYRVVYTHPADGETVKAQIELLTESERFGLPVP